MPNPFQQGTNTNLRPGYYQAPVGGSYNNNTASSDMNSYQAGSSNYGGSYSSSMRQNPPSSLQNMQSSQMRSNSISMQPQHSGFYSGMPQTQPLNPADTGFVQQLSSGGLNNEVKIPAVKLNFLAPSDQQKYETIFRSQVKKGSNTIDGTDCRSVLMRSGLSPSQLAQIWALSDSNRAGSLLFPEFCLAMHLVRETMNGKPIPYSVDSKIKKEVDSFVDTITLMIANDADSSDQLPTTNPFGSSSSPIQSDNTAPNNYSTSNLPPLPSRIPSQQQAQHSGLSNLQNQISPGRTQMQSSSPNKPISSSNVQMGPAPLSNFQTPHYSGQKLQTPPQPQHSISTPNMGMSNQQLPMNQDQRLSLRPSGPTQPSLIPSRSTVQPQISGIQQQTSGITPQSSGIPPQSSGMLQHQSSDLFTSQYNNQNIPAQASGTFNFNIPIHSQSTGGAMTSPQGTGFMPHVDFGFQVQNTGNGLLQSQATGGALQAQRTGGIPHFQVNSVPLQNQKTGNNMLQAQVTGSANGIMQQSTGSFATNYQNAGGPIGLQPNNSGMQYATNNAPMKPLTAQKTGFGNNQIYNKTNFAPPSNESQGNSISEQERALYNKIFNTYDVDHLNFIKSPTAVEIFRKSGLTRADLEHIWNLCDTNNNGQLERDEFVVGMHLVYQTLNGKPLPQSLPPDMAPKYNGIQDSQMMQNANTIPAMNISQSQPNIPNMMNNQPPAINAGHSQNNMSNMNNIQSQNNMNNMMPQQNGLQNQDTITPHLSTQEKLQQLQDMQKQKEKEEQEKRQQSERDEKLHQAVQNSLNAKIMTLQNAIRDKRSKLSEMQSKLNNDQIQYAQKRENILAINDLKKQINDLPNVEVKISSTFPQNTERRIDGIMKNIPLLFSKISSAENSISDIKIQLHNAKNPNSNNSVEVEKIKAESAKNSRNINDIEKTIAELSASLVASMTDNKLGKDVDKFSKWEFGIDLQQPVRDLIGDLKSHDHVILAVAPPPSLSPESSHIHQPHVSPTSPVNVSQHQHPHHIAASISPVDHTQVHHHNQRISSTSPVAIAQHHRHTTTTSPYTEDSDDEEERRLREELARLKLQKKTEKEKRLADLRRQVEEAKAAANRH